MTGKRDDTIDIAKGIGMTIVVLFHAEIFAGLWQQFHMPLFAFLSGIVYREKHNESLSDVLLYVKKKFKTIYFPFVIYNVVFMVFHNFFCRIYILEQNIYTLRDYVKKFCAIITLGGGESIPGPMWYLIAMLEFTILYTLIRFVIGTLIKKEGLREFCVFVCCAIFLVVGYSEIALPRMLNRAFVLIFFYNLGFLYKTYMESDRSSHNSLRKYMIPLSLIVLVLGNILKVDWPFFSILSIPASISGIYLIEQLSEIINTVKLKGLFSFIGKHTIFILGTQYLWFKVAAIMQILILQYDISWLSTYGVNDNEISVWKLVYFICGLFIPLALILIKDTIMNKIRRISK